MMETKIDISEFNSLFNIKQLDYEESIFEKEDIFGYSINEQRNFENKIKNFFVYGNGKFYMKEKEKEWIEIKTSGGVPAPRRFHSSIIFDNSFYILGGKTLKKTMMKDFYKLNLGIHILKHLN